MQSGTGTGGHLAAGLLSMGPEALKLQEMWDGLEGLRRGACGLGVLLCRRGVEGVRGLTCRLCGPAVHW